MADWLAHTVKTGGRIARLPHLPNVLYSTLAVVAAVQQYALWNGVPGDAHNLHVNNFLIFRQSFVHLLNNSNLYAAYPAEHFDLFKYSPTFALAMAPWALLPVLPGLIAWNLLNASVFVWGLRTLRLPVVSTLTIALIAAIEAMANLQNGQSNLLMAGLLMAAVGLQERGKLLGPAALIAASGLVKVFGWVAAPLAVVYARRTGLWRPVRLLLVLAVVLGLAALPVIVVGPGALLWQYRNWWELLKWDEAISQGYSVMAFVGHLLPGVAVSNGVVQLLGLGLLLAPLLRLSAYANPTWRMLLLASVLVWMVIFNHKAESPTFVIAMAGVGLWWVHTARKWPHTALLVFALLLTSLASTDFLPVYVRNTYIKPYGLKALPSVLIWGWLQVQLWRLPATR